MGVGVGFPKQESVISVLRRHRPAAWDLGCGAAINFVDEALESRYGTATPLGGMVYLQLVPHMAPSGG